jgi:hypothetical protein
MDDGVKLGKPGVIAIDIRPSGLCTVSAEYDSAMRIFEFHPKHEGYADIGLVTACVGDLMLGVSPEEYADWMLGAKK